MQAAQSAGGPAWRCSVCSHDWSTASRLKDMDRVTWRGIRRQQISCRVSALSRRQRRVASVHFMRAEATAISCAEQDGDPINSRRTVDLPESFSPRKPKIEPFDTANDTWSPHREIAKVFGEDFDANHGHTLLMEVSPITHPLVSSLGIILPREEDERVKSDARRRWSYAQDPVVPPVGSGALPR